MANKEKRKLNGLDDLEVLVKLVVAVVSEDRVRQQELLVSPPKRTKNRFRSNVRVRINRVRTVCFV